MLDFITGSASSEVLPASVVVISLAAEIIDMLQQTVLRSRGRCEDPTKRRGTPYIQEEDNGRHEWTNEMECMKLGKEGEVVALLSFELGGSAGDAMPVSSSYATSPWPSGSKQHSSGFQNLEH